MTDAPVASSVDPDDLVTIIRGDAVMLTSAATLLTAPTDAAAAAGASIAALTAQLASANAAIVALAQRVAALEGKPDPCVPLSGSLPVATLQLGTVDVAVPVPGLLTGDRIAYHLGADLPDGLRLGAVRPSPAANGILLVQATATLSLSGKSAIPIAVTALR